MIQKNGRVVYIAGALAYKTKLRLKCKECIEFFIDRENSYEIDSTSETDYFESMNRGSLLKPSMFLLGMVKICLNFFELYIRPAIGMTIKNPSSPQLRELLFAFLQRVSFFLQI